LKQRQAYQCSACGARTPQWRGQCPTCSEWNTLEAVTVRPERKSSAKTAAPAAESAVALQEVASAAASVLSTGMPDLDALLGGGLVPGGSMLLGGEPGIGKSTILLQAAGSVAAAGGRSLYVSGEESLNQLRSRAERLEMLTPALQALATSSAGDVLDILERERVDFLVVDSVQTLASAQADGLPGSVGQVRAVAMELMEACRSRGTALMLVGHVTKEGHIAGPKLLEHMVDTVLALEGDRRNLYRILRVLKNRFGPTQELLVLRMAGKGMEIVHDPSTLFLGARDPGLSGTAVAMAVDGQRPFAVEVQALVSRSHLSFPRRTSLGLDVNRLHLLLAVLEKRLSLNLGEVDIYAKIGGGLRLQDPGLDLALVAAVLSSLYDRPLPERAALWGEVDLNGQVRPVVGQEVRMAQARRLGYQPALCPPEHDKEGGVRTLQDLHRRLFGKQKGD
jgi:DNA repair protein RadA/Sms